MTTYGNLLNDKSQRAALQALLDGSSESLQLKQDATLSADALFPGSVEREVAERLADRRSISDFGPVDPTGVTAMDATISSATNADDLIIDLLPGTYRLANEVVFGGANLVIRGVPGRTKITGADAPTLLQVATGCTNVTFEGIEFESTYVSASELVAEALIYSPNKTWDGLFFSRCIFRCEDSGANAFKLLCDIDGILSEGLQIDLCKFIGIARMGFEVQNHHATTPEIVRYRNFTISRSLFKNIGTQYQGQPVSFSGFSPYCHTIGCVLDDIGGGGLEYARGGVGCQVIGNRWRNNTRPTYLLSITDGNQAAPAWRSGMISDNVADPEIASPSTTDDETGGVLFENVSNSKISNNHFRISAHTTMRDSSNNNVSDNIFDGRGSYGLYIEGTSLRNMLKNNQYYTTRSSTALSALRFLGSGVQLNVVDGGRIKKGSSGVEIDESTSAVDNVMLINVRLGDNHPTSAVSIALSDANYTVGITLSSRKRFIFTGTLSTGRNVTFPKLGIEAIIVNQTNQTLTVLPSGGSGATVAAGVVAAVGGTATAYTATVLA